MGQQKTLQGFCNTSSPFSNEIRKKKEVLIRNRKKDKILCDISLVDSHCSSW
jgi:hypothetical protein